MAFKVNATTVIDNNTQHLVAGGSGGVGNRLFHSAASVSAGDPLVLLANGSVTSVTTYSDKYTTGTINPTLASNTTSNMGSIAAAFHPYARAFIYSSQGSLLNVGNDVKDDNFLYNTSMTRANSTAYSYGGEPGTVHINPVNGETIISYGVYPSPNSYYKARLVNINNNTRVPTFPGSELDLGNGSGQQTKYLFGYDSTHFLNDANNTVFTVQTDISDTVGARLFAINSVAGSITSITSNNSYFSGYQKYVYGSFAISNTSSGYTDIYSFWYSGGATGQGFVVFQANSSAILVANSGSVANQSTWINGTTDNYGEAYFDANTSRALAFFGEYGSANQMHWGCYQIGWSSSKPTVTMIASGNFSTFGNNGVFIPFNSTRTDTGEFVFAYKTSNNHMVSVGRFNWTNPGWSWSVSNSAYWVSANSDAVDTGTVGLEYNPFTGYAVILSKRYTSNQAVHATMIRVGSNYKSFIGIAANASSGGTTLEAVLPGGYANVNSSSAVMGYLPGSAVYLNPLKSPTITTRAGPESLQIGRMINTTNTMLVL